MVSTHLKNISQIGNLPQIGVKIKNTWNHHLVKNLSKFGDLKGTQKPENDLRGYNFLKKKAEPGRESTIVLPTTSFWGALAVWFDSGRKSDNNLQKSLRVEKHLPVIFSASFIIILQFRQFTYDGFV